MEQTKLALLFALLTVAEESGYVLNYSSIELFSDFSGTLREGIVEEETHFDSLDEAVAILVEKIKEGKERG